MQLLLSYPRFAMDEVRTHAGLACLVVLAHLVVLYCLLSGAAPKPLEKDLPAEVEVNFITPPPRPSVSPPTVPVMQHPVSKPVLPQVQSATALTAPAQEPDAALSPPQAMPTNEPTPAPPAVAVKEAVIQPQPETPPTISSGVEYIRPPQPSYPASAKRRGEQGQVVFRVLISEQGQVEKLEIQKSSGFLNLDEAGRQAVSKAAFKPYVMQGKAIAVYVIVPISFKLDI